MSALKWLPVLPINSTQHQVIELPTFLNHALTVAVYVILMQLQTILRRFQGVDKRGSTVYKSTDTNFMISYSIKIVVLQLATQPSYS